MGRIVDGLLDGVDAFLAWMSASLGQTTESYLEVETADSQTVLVAHDGSLISVLKVYGVMGIDGQEEFDKMRDTLSLSLRTAMGQPGHALQVYFNQDLDSVYNEIEENYKPARQTAENMRMELDDLFNERVNFIGTYCASEQVYFVFWTRPISLAGDQLKEANKEKMQFIKKNKLPPFSLAQNVIAAIPELRDGHDAFVRSVLNDLSGLNMHAELMEVHDAVYAMRQCADPEFTGRDWYASLPGDRISVREINGFKGNVSDILWPSLAKQILPRDVEGIDMRTCRVGDRVYSTLFIDLFPKDIKNFTYLFRRTLAARIPWRISFLLESEGLNTMRFKGMLTAILSFSSSQNRLISDATNLLQYLNTNTDDAIVRMRVALATWAPYDNISLLRRRSSELVKAVQGWGTCEVSESCGDPIQGFVSSLLAATTNNAAPASLAPLQDVVYMLPITRPASMWSEGALLFRTPDGKPWPFQPGSSQQTTWIDIIYARPGSGKSVLSNAINLALCLQGGITRLPRIAIIDIGPSSSGLISLLRESLPPESRHYVQHYRVRMTPEYSVNPFDTQLGARFPNPAERAFLVNFLTLLTTPLGSTKPYDAIPDLAGMVVDELYKSLSESGNPHVYAGGIEPLIDGILEEIGFVRDSKTTWWEVTDALFLAGFVVEAHTAQRYCMPLLADAASMCRESAVEDLYGRISTPTGESLIDAFARMISGSVREYPILSRVTAFDLGEAKVVALDLDEVAKSGGDAADRQTAVMYMLARYIMARHYYLTEETVSDMNPQYREYHAKRILEIREDPKRIVYDEFHRTSKSQAVRDQVILDMREGRKWKVQIALLSQSLDDFDKVMVEFATAIYIMDAGPSSAVEKTAQVFGLSPTAKTALRTRVHGPRAGGATFLAIFSTKQGINTQLLTMTLGPIELWSFSTTAEDANIRNKLYKHIGPAEARRVLARLFPNGTVTKLLEQRLNLLKEDSGLISEEQKEGMVDKLLAEILQAYSVNPDVRSLPTT